MSTQPATPPFQGADEFPSLGNVYEPPRTFCDPDQRTERVHNHRTGKKRQTHCLFRTSTPRKARPWAAPHSPQPIPHGAATKLCPRSGRGKKSFEERTEGRPQRTGVTGLVNAPPSRSGRRATGWRSPGPSSFVLLFFFCFFFFSLSVDAAGRNHVSVRRLTRRTTQYQTSALGPSVISHTTPRSVTAPARTSRADASPRQPQRINLIVNPDKML